MTEAAAPPVTVKPEGPLDFSTYALLSLRRVCLVAGMERNIQAACIADHLLAASACVHKSPEAQSSSTQL